MSNDEAEALVISGDPLHPANLIPELCAGFYRLGWVTGTGGGICIRVGDKVYLAPSGVQKERIEPSHMFVLPYPQPTPSPHTDRIFLRRPKQNLKESACTPLFWNAFEKRNAGSCIHTHSQNAVMATLLWEGDFFEISHQMIKGIRIGGNGKAMSYLDTLRIPIIPNTPFEEDLTDSMAAAMVKYPDAPAILVKRHGIYVWGDDWQKAKTQTECLDYLFEIGVKMKLAGLPTVLDGLSQLPGTSHAVDTDVQPSDASSMLDSQGIHKTAIHISAERAKQKRKLEEGEHEKEGEREKERERARKKAAELHARMNPPY